MRPSPGAAGSGRLGALEDFDAATLADVAAPGDGRTPAAVSSCAQVAVLVRWLRICGLDCEGLSARSEAGRRLGASAATALVFLDRFPRAEMFLMFLDVFGLTDLN